MAKTKATSPSSVTVRYDLHDLPTAQHKAGLAGLLLQAESMRDRGLPAEGIPDLSLESPATVVATLTAASLIGLFDDLYDAEPVKVESPSRWANATPLGEVQRPDKDGKMKTRFVYEITQPSGHFFRRYTDGRDAWLKLWRNMLWDIPRGKPTTRGPYNARAENPKKSSGEGEAAWKELLTIVKAAKKGGVATSCEIGSALLLGAQAVNAESVPFRDRVDHALLLHLWPLTTRIFVPERFEADGERNFVGYVLAVPEVADLPSFIDTYKQWLGTLDTKLNGYRPAESVVSLPAQGALEFMDGLARITVTRTGQIDYNPVAQALVGVDYFHLDKRGNNVKSFAQGRVAADRDLLRKYDLLRRQCRNPLFRQARLLSLVKQSPTWFAAFDDLFAGNAASLFVNTADTPAKMPSFAWDTRLQFGQIIETDQRRKEDAMTDGSPPPPARLEAIVYHLVRTYVQRKTEQKSGLTYESFKNNTTPDAKGKPRVSYPKTYTEAQERVCEDLFLGMRSRRDEDFADFFTDTVCYYPQRKAMPNVEDFAVIARALLDKETRRDVKTLAMLAVSAASYAVRNDEEPKETP